MSKDLTVPFDVTGWKEEPWDTTDGATLARATVAKEFHGAMEGSTSVAEIVTAVSADGPAAYVGIERVNGNVAGRSGSFVLMHSATTEDESAGVSVVSGLGTGELASLRGSGTITIDEDGGHTLRLTYEVGG